MMSNCSFTRKIIPARSNELIVINILKNVAITKNSPLIPCRHHSLKVLFVDEEDYVVEGDSGEISDFTQKSDFSVDELVNSGSFEMTHIAKVN
jgi:hypothetical protein